MVSKDRLQRGAYYYFVTYEDRALTVPVIETLCFTNEDSGDQTGRSLLVFDRLGSDKPKQCRLTEELLHTLFEFDGLVSELQANLEAQRAGRPYEPKFP
jgi:hypothetical protein